MDKIELNTDIAWLENRTIFLAKSGSYASGTNVESSDKDYKGICIPPKEYYLGLKIFNEYNKNKGKTFRNTKDDIDIKISHINKFVIEAMYGSINSIDILFVKENDIIKINKFGSSLLSHKHDFLSNNLKLRYDEYSNSHIYKIKNMKGKQDLVMKYGYDTKDAMHLIKSSEILIEIFKTGTFCTYRNNANELIDIREGKYSLHQIIQVINDLKAELNELCSSNIIVPNQPDINKIENWLIDLNKTALLEEW